MRAAPEIGMEEAQEILGLSSVFTKASLKSAYRKAASEFHPDHGGEAEKFRKAQLAYEILQPFVSAEDVDKEAFDLGGLNIEELGKGYPLSEAARTCEHCEGKGYRIVRDHRSLLRTCSICKGDGLRRVPCKRCMGTGRFRVNGKDRGECRGCEGTGVFIPAKYRAKTDGYGSSPESYRYHRNLGCLTCDGDGTIREYREEGVAYALKCSECKGVGEVKMWNPVLPRGFLSSKA